MRPLKHGMAALCALAALSLASPGHAAGPYTENTSGTTQNGMLEALADIVEQGEVGGLDAVRIGAADETAAATPAATSGLNGLLKGLWTGLRSVIGTKAPGTAADNSLLTGCVYNTTLPTLTTGQQAAVQCSLRGQVAIAGLAMTGADGVANGGGINGVPNTGGTASPNATAGWYFNGTSWDRIRGNTDGAVVQVGAVAASRWTYPAASGGISNTTTAVTIKAAAGASVKNYVLGCQISHDTLGGATELAIRDGAGGTVLWRGKLQTAALPLTPLPIPSPLAGSNNTLLEVVTLSAVTGGVYVNCQGHTGS